jgi:hypothetical protein
MNSVKRLRGNAAQLAPMEVQHLPHERWGMVRQVWWTSRVKSCAKRRLIWWKDNEWYVFDIDRNFWKWRACRGNETWPEGISCSYNSQPPHESTIVKMTNICGSNQSQQFLLTTLLQSSEHPTKCIFAVLTLSKIPKKVSSPLRTGFNVVNPIVYTTPYPICIPFASMCPIYSNLIYQLQ